MNDEKMLRKIHFTMAVIGGFIGVYGILIRQDLFGNSQTSNVIFIVISILGRKIFDFITRFFALLIYMAGTVIVVIWKKKIPYDVRYFAIAVDFFSLIILGLLPRNMDPVIGLYPIFFSASDQWNVFAGVHGYNCSTIFSTNNIKQFTISSTEYLLEKDPKKKHRATFYGLTLLSFYFGVTLGYFAVVLLDVKGAFLGLPIVLTALTLIRVSEHSINYEMEPAK